MGNGTEHRSVPPFVEPPPPAHQRKGQQSARLIMMFAGSGMLFLSMMGAGKLLWEILGDMNKPEMMGAKLLWLAILFLTGWVVSLINIRVFYDWVQPIIIQGFIWLTLGGILAVYARIIIRFYNQDFVEAQYVHYSLAFMAGFVALLSLHLLIEDHDLRPCAIPIAALAFVHILTAGMHYVFRNDSDPNFAIGDAGWLIFMVFMFLITSQNFALLAPFRNLLNDLFPKRENS